MRNCNFPQNIIDELELTFENDTPPTDFTATLYYYTHRLNERRGEMFWEYYTTNATYEEIGETYGISRARVQQEITTQARRLRHHSIKGDLEEGLFAHLEGYRQEARENAAAIFERERDKVYQRGYADGYRDRRNEELGEDYENRPAPEFSWTDEIMFLPLSVRAHNALAMGGIRTVGDIIRTNPVTLLNLRNMGIKTYKEITDVLVERCGERRENWELKPCKTKSSASQEHGEI